MLFSCYQYVASRCVLRNFDLKSWVKSNWNRHRSSRTSSHKIKNIFTFLKQKKQGLFYSREYINFLPIFRRARPSFFTGVTYSDGVKLRRYNLNKEQRECVNVKI